MVFIPDLHSAEDDEEDAEVEEDVFCSLPSQLARKEKDGCGALPASLLLLLLLLLPGGGGGGNMLPELEFSRRGRDRFLFRVV